MPLLPEQAVPVRDAYRCRVRFIVKGGFATSNSTERPRVDAM